MKSRIMIEPNASQPQREKKSIAQKQPPKPPKPVLGVSVVHLGITECVFSPGMKAG